tara:strand:- start:99 stop:962 length:864 start_codon:yes stop_codon:yes gene_type:complete
MKTIDTLVKDIYNLFENAPVNLSEEEIFECIDEFGDNIKEHLRAALYEEQGKGRNNLRLSAIGRPDRQMWYDVNRKQNGDPISSSTRIKFLYGHILEELLIALSRLAGHKVSDTQKELNVEGVKGHQDCMIDDVLVDCKSTSPRGFEKFAKGDLVKDDPFGYIAQISAYAEGNGVDEAAFLAINKQSGEICLSPVHSLEMINAGDRVKHLKSMVKSKTPPAKCYSDVKEGASGNKRLGTSCIYCNHKRECWKDANDGHGLRVFNYARGYRYLTKVSKVPDVPEITQW